MKFVKKLLLTLFLSVLVIGGSMYLVSATTNRDNEATGAVPTPVPDKYLAFSFEVWDKIKNNYWDKISDEDLAKLYKLAAEKILGSTASYEPKNKDDVGLMISDILNKSRRSDEVGIPTESSGKEFVTQLVDIVLANLKPFGRSRLYTFKQQEALKNNVENVDTSTDLYSVLDLKKGASTDEIKLSYEKKTGELKKNKSEEAIQKLAMIQRAYDALAVPEKKETYDKSGVEPTVISKLITTDIFYIKLTKFSPQSFDELKKAADSIDPKKTGGPTSLVFDLRGNIGGAIDILQYFLGPFIGNDRYAYEFFHQGETTPYKTKIGWFESLVRYKKVVILVDSQSQSSAEVMAATLKKYNVGILVGTPTKGWGTVEQVMPMDNQLDDNEKYSVFLVHSVTLRDDGQPIESRGVDPTINTNDKDWQKQLLAYFNYQPLVDAVKELIYKK